MLPRSHALRCGGGSARSSARCLARSVRGSRLTPERGGRKAAPPDDASHLATAPLTPSLFFPPGRFLRCPFFPFLTTPPWVTLARSDDARGEEEVGAPRAGGCASGRGTSRRCRRLYGRVRIEERKGRSRVEPKLPPDLTPDPTVAGRARSVAVSSRAGGDCSFGSKEEGPGRAAMVGRAPPEAWLRISQ
ncbi:uncharacterized protein LOC118022241 [Mirounga leonina]|uniref:uncharacterized protein LOC118022241 n=1 Tax=Mirounga leonina TaxID=9715 RepID=UPI00156C2388|nr:uncharacterized protein LOC118022241 [Mirounga leonina]